ncbi:MAG: TIGR03085 family metal-binding protein [Gordonia sp. (in: high G+C Gram-positive bacteria)]
MLGPNYAQRERHAMVDTLREAGPDAPTLCDGWTTRDLVVHLVVRERRPDAAPGIFVPVLSEYTDRVSRSVAGTDWDELLTTIDDGPPWFSPLKAIDRVANLAEMFVHHEDVLRGGADPNSPWMPRALTSGMESALELPLKTVGRMTLSSSPARITLGTGDGRPLLTAGKGSPVTVTGSVGELLLFAYGRKPVDVEVTGAPSVVAKVLGAERSV